MSRKRIENNISYDERNRLYYVTFHYGMDASGKRVKKTKTYDTHIAAAQALRIFEMKKQRQEIVMPTELTVGMWLDRWLEEVIRPNRARSTTYGYSNMIKNHIKPALGKIILQELTPQQIQAYYLAMREAGLNTNTVHKHHQLLFTALDFAVRQEVLNRNPVRRVVCRLSIQPPVSSIASARTSPIATPCFISRAPLSNVSVTVLLCCCIRQLIQ